MNRQRKGSAMGGGVRGKLAGMILTSLLLCASPSLAEPQTTAMPTATTLPEQEILIQIRLRQFDPPTVTLQRGRKTKLVFHNLDSELHAFVPTNLFTGVNLNISGNGAPEFTEQGFKRVIIPPEGLAEIRFVPDRAGTYPYLCDMPGHDMKASIVVREQAEP
jgi:plastocyanin